MMRASNSSPSAARLGVGPTRKYQAPIGGLKIEKFKFGENLYRVTHQVGNKVGLT